ncbi:MAG: RIO1 family regulatory kinase/ATPase [Ignisphaera sp.]
MAKLGELYRKLTKSDIMILKYMVSIIGKYEYIPVENFMRKFRKIWNQKEIVARIKKLNELGLIQKHANVEAYRLKSIGLDCVAIYMLVNNNIIKALGDPIGVGKESIIFNGLTPDGNIVAIKFYKIGRRSFRHVVKVRPYTTHIENDSWLIRSILAGKREKEALTVLNKCHIIGIPRLYGHALHTIVIEFIDGINLYKVYRIDNPLEIFNQIIDVVRNSYKCAKIIHGDLSEYNIMVQFDDVVKSYIIDWPQYVLANDPQAPDVLKKDIVQLARFFNRRFKLDIHPDRILENILT